MRAVVLRGPRDARVESVPDPSPAGPGDLVLEVILAGLCGTDAHEWASGPRGYRTPLVLGHEFVARVVEVGAGVSGFAVGDRVVSGAGVSCGTCDWCRAGRTNLCATYRTIGQQVDGGLAGRVRVPASTCVPVPERLDDMSAVLAQPMAVSVHAARRGVSPGATHCVVIGAGAVGSLLVPAARAVGFDHVDVVDLDPAKLAGVRRLGARQTRQATTTGLEEALVDLVADHPPAVVFETTGAPGAVPAAAQVVSRGGRVVLVGLPRGHVPIDITSLVLREVDLVSSLAHVKADDLPAAIDLLADGTVASVVIAEDVIGLDDVPVALAAIAEGRNGGKVVVDPHR